MEITSPLPFFPIAPSHVPKQSCKEALLSLFASVPRADDLFEAIVHRARDIVSDTGLMRSSLCTLTNDEIVALVAYTADLASIGGDSKDNLFRRLNHILRHRDMVNFTAPMADWYWYLMCGIRKIPPQRITTYRGIHEDEIIHSETLMRRYSFGKTICWPAFTSTTTTMLPERMSNNHNVLYTIKCHSARCIRGLSLYQEEAEYLLPPNVAFTVESATCNSESGTVTVTLNERDSHPWASITASPTTILEQVCVELSAVSRYSPTSNLSERFLSGGMTWDMAARMLVGEKDATSRQRSVGYWALGFAAAAGSKVTLTHDGAALSKRDCFVEAIKSDGDNVNAYKSLAACLGVRETLTLADGRKLDRASCFSEAISSSHDVANVLPSDGYSAIRDVDVSCGHDEPYLCPFLWFCCGKDRLRGGDRIQQSTQPLAPAVVREIERARRESRESMSHPNLHAGQMVDLQFESLPPEMLRVDGASHRVDVIINKSRTLMGFRCSWFFVNDNCNLEPVSLEDHVTYDAAYQNYLRGHGAHTLTLECEDPVIGVYRRIVDFRDLSSTNEMTQRTRPLYHLGGDSSDVDTSSDMGTAQWIINAPNSRPRSLPYASVVQLERELARMQQCSRPSRWVFVSTNGDLSRYGVRDLKVQLVAPLEEVTHFREAYLTTPATTREPVKVTLTRYIPSCFMMNEDGLFEPLHPEDAQELRSEAALGVEKGYQVRQENQSPCVLMFRNATSHHRTTTLRNTYPGIAARCDAALSTSSERSSVLKRHVYSEKPAVAHRALMNILVAVLKCRIVGEAVATTLVLDGGVATELIVELPTLVDFVSSSSWLDMMMDVLVSVYGCSVDGPIQEFHSHDGQSRQTTQRGEFLLRLSTPDVTMRMVPSWNVDKFRKKHGYRGMDAFYLDPKHGLSVYRPTKGALMDAIRRVVSLGILANVDEENDGESSSLTAIPSSIPGKIPVASQCGRSSATPSPKSKCLLQSWYFVNNQHELEPIPASDANLYNEGYAQYKSGGAHEMSLPNCVDPEIGTYCHTVNFKELFSKNETTRRCRALVHILDVSTERAEFGIGARQWTVDVDCETPLTLPFASVVHLETELQTFLQKPGTSRKVFVPTSGDMTCGGVRDLKVELGTSTSANGKMRFAGVWTRPDDRHPGVKVETQVTVTRFVPSLFVQGDKGARFVALDAETAPPTASALLARGQEESLLQPWYFLNDQCELETIPPELVNVEPYTCFAECGIGATQWKIHAVEYNDPIPLPYASTLLLEQAFLQALERSSHPSQWSYVCTSGDASAASDLKVNIGSFRYGCDGTVLFFDQVLWKTPQGLLQVTLTRFVPSVFAMNKKTQRLVALDSELARSLDEARWRSSASVYAPPLTDVDGVREYDRVNSQPRCGDDSHWEPLVFSKRWFNMNNGVPHLANNDTTGGLFFTTPMVFARQGVAQLAELTQMFPGMAKRLDAALSVSKERKHFLAWDIVSPDSSVAMLALMNVLVTELRCRVVGSAVATSIVLSVGAGEVVVQLPSSAWSEGGKTVCDRIIDVLVTRLRCGVTLTKWTQQEFSLHITNPSVVLRMQQDPALFRSYTTVENICLDPLEGLCLVDGQLPRESLALTIESVRSKVAVPTYDVKAIEVKRFTGEGNMQQQCHHLESVDGASRNGNACIAIVGSMLPPASAEAVGKAIRLVEEELKFEWWDRLPEDTLSLCDVISLTQQLTNRHTKGLQLAQALYDEARVNQTPVGRSYRNAALQALLHNIDMSKLSIPIANVVCSVLQRGTKASLIVDSDCTAMSIQRLVDQIESAANVWTSTLDSLADIFHYLLAFHRDSTWHLRLCPSAWNALKTLTHACCRIPGAHVLLVDIMKSLTTCKSWMQFYERMGNLLQRDCSLLQDPVCFVLTTMLEESCESRDMWTSIGLCVLCLLRADEALLSHPTRQDVLVSAFTKVFDWWDLTKNQPSVAHLKHADNVTIIISECVRVALELHASVPRVSDIGLLALDRCGLAVLTFGSDADLDDVKSKMISQYDVALVASAAIESLASLHTHDERVLRCLLVRDALRHMPLDCSSSNSDDKAMESVLRVTQAITSSPHRTLVAEFVESVVLRRMLQFVFDRLASARQKRPSLQSAITAETSSSEGMADDERSKAAHALSKMLCAVVQAHEDPCVVAFFGPDLLSASMQALCDVYEEVKREDANEEWPDTALQRVLLSVENTTTTNQVKDRDVIRTLTSIAFLLNRRVLAKALSLVPPAIVTSQLVRLSECLDH